MQNSDIDLVLTPNSAFWEMFYNITGFIGYVIPMGTVRSIIEISVMLMGIRLVIALLKMLWSIIPIL